MDVQDLERIAATEGSELPNGLATHEQLLFLTLRELYQNYRSGAVNRERAKKEKNRIFVAYEGLKHDHKRVEHQLQIRRRLEREIGSLYTCGCANCRKVAMIFDGMDRRDIPEDIKEVHSWNEKLRELVKERSERAAHLATNLHMIQIVLNSNASPEEKLEKISKYAKEKTQ